MWALITLSVSLLFFSFTALDKNAVIFLFACLLSSRCASRGNDPRDAQRVLSHQ
jgi:hypothetical protein